MIGQTLLHYRTTDPLGSGRGGVTVGALLLSFLWVVPGHAEDLPAVTLPPPLARVLTDYESAWETKDAPALARLFAEDGFVLSPGTAAVRGRAAIEAHYRGRGGPLSLRALTYATEGSVGYVIGGYARSRGEPDIGKFTLTLRREANGRWLIVSDMDNGNSRP